MTSAWASVNGVVGPAGEARVALYDRGLLFADGAFETLRTLRHQPVALEAHLARLRATTAWLGFALPEAALRADLAGALTAWQAAQADQVGVEARIKLLVTSGLGHASGPTTLAPPPELRPTTMAVVEPLASTLTSPRALMVWPCTVDVACAQHKLLGYLPKLRAWRAARNAGYDDAVVLDDRAGALECATANLFVYVDGRWRTPEAETGCLPGVARARLLAAAPDIEPGPISAQALAFAEAAVATSAVRGVMPIARIGLRTLPRWDRALALRDRYDRG